MTSLGSAAALFLALHNANREDGSRPTLALLEPGKLHQLLTVLVITSLVTAVSYVLVFVCLRRLAPSTRKWRLKLCWNRPHTSTLCSMEVCVLAGTTLSTRAAEPVAHKQLHFTSSSRGAKEVSTLTPSGLDPAFLACMAKVDKVQSLLKERRLVVSLEHPKEEGACGSPGGGDLVVQSGTVKVPAKSEEEVVTLRQQLETSMQKRDSLEEELKASNASLNELKVSLRIAQGELDLKSKELEEAQKCRMAASEQELAKGVARRLESLLQEQTRQVAELKRRNAAYETELAELRLAKPASPPTPKLNGLEGKANTSWAAPFASPTFSVAWGTPGTEKVKKNKSPEAAAEQELVEMLAEAIKGETANTPPVAGHVRFEDSPWTPTISSDLPSPQASKSEPPSPEPVLLELANTLEKKEVRRSPLLQDFSQALGWSPIPSATKQEALVQ